MVKTELQRIEDHIPQPSEDGLTRVVGVVVLSKHVLESMLNRKTKWRIIIRQAESGVRSSERFGSVTVLPVGSCNGPNLKEVVEVTTLQGSQIKTTH